MDIEHEVSAEEFRNSIERWLAGLTGEDKRMRDAFIAAYESRSYVVTRLFQVCWGEYDDMADSDYPASYHFEQALEIEVASWLRPETAAIAVYNHIVRGENPVLSHPRRAAEALGLDIRTITNGAVKKFNLLSFWSKRGADEPPSS